MKPGDLVFFWGNDVVSKLIELTTFGPSHVGILTNYKGQLLLAESTTLCPHPCIAQNKCVSGVQLHPLADRVRDYPRGRVRLYPLVDDCQLTPAQTTRLEELVTSYLGTTYDYTNAALSATSFIKYLPGLPYPDKQSLFCSALVARWLQVLNRMNWSNPESHSPSGLHHALRRTAVIEPGQLLYPDYIENPNP